MRLFNTHSYIGTIEILGKVIYEFPEFFKNPKAYYYVAKSFHLLGAREIAMTLAYSVESNYPAAKAVHYSKLLLLELSKDEMALDMVVDFYNQLNTDTVSDSIKVASKYHLGLTYLHDNKLDSAQKYLSYIPDTFSDYKTVQEALLILNYLRINNKMIGFFSSLVHDDEYYRLRAQYAEICMEYWEYVLAKETSYTIEEKSRLSKKIEEYSLVMKQYHDPLKNEKKRILQLIQNEEQ